MIRVVMMLMMLHMNKRMMAMTMVMTVAGMIVLTITSY